MTDYYPYYCDAADEINNNCENYPDDIVYPRIWAKYVRRYQDYLICLDKLCNFIYNNDDEILYEFSKCCDKIKL